MQKSPVIDLHGPHDYASHADVHAAARLQTRDLDGKLTFTGSILSQPRRLSVEAGRKRRKQIRLQYGVLPVVFAA